ncbi:hypothetical protein FIBSPDRAFT_962624 [Athelia psychrophila]|uniref:Uncharacterized protein n=1 Tax=Athelia psychrophila TaxID=1759441 RepID=A0A165ZYL9_9AGAM|nr:hypothetical protein FIBSPDRAFT_962624 [Fibularhizoctonia sp. CBS 109695]
MKARNHPITSVPSSLRNIPTKYNIIIIIRIRIRIRICICIRIRIHHRSIRRRIRASHSYSYFIHPSAVASALRIRIRLRIRPFVSPHSLRRIITLHPSYPRIHASRFQHASPSATHAKPSDRTMDLSVGGISSELLSAHDLPASQDVSPVPPSDVSETPSEHLQRNALSFTIPTLPILESQVADDISDLLYMLYNTHF